jgi:hypothetical protein
MGDVADKLLQRLESAFFRSRGRYMGAEAAAISRCPYVGQRISGFEVNRAVGMMTIFN